MSGTNPVSRMEYGTRIPQGREALLSKDKNSCCTWKNVASVAGAIFVLAGIAGFVGVGLMFSPLVLPTMGLIFTTLALTTPLSVALAAGGSLLLGFIFLVARKGCCSTKEGSEGYVKKSSEETLPRRQSVNASIESDVKFRAEKTSSDSPQTRLPTEPLAGGAPSREVASQSIADPVASTDSGSPA